MACASRWRSTIDRGHRGVTGALEIELSAMDGYTFGLLASLVVCAVPLLRKNPPFDTLRDFVAVG